MGIDPSRFTPLGAEKAACRRKNLGFGKNLFCSFIRPSFPHRKNHALLIRALLRQPFPTRIFCSRETARLVEECRALTARLGAQKRIHFLGYVQDMPGLYPCATPR
jgi:glycosyltransferase EpsD